MSFSTVLVANRGEIAVRILKAARQAGLRTVAVFSDADSGAPHVQYADAAVRIGPAPAAESYLSITALLEAAERSQADAIHPGYGFLSENATFSRACTEKGLVFVGPPPDVIEMLGRKDIARRMAAEAGVPVLPAIEDCDEPTLVQRATEEIGFPLLVKAAAGGGGKGMRVVRRSVDLPEALAAARREALAGFGDDAVLIERYMEHGRHIEVQILADTHGNVVHFFERDCSVQRRYQKVIEEAPALAISDGLREHVTLSAIDLAKHVGYINAGTVEFLVSGDDAYMLEVNTRLQVEHPVTEMITGYDLVTLQLLVAQGHPLPMSQHDIVIRGHAIEARIYAEDPDQGFLPQAGMAEYVRWPKRARVDEALVSGQRVEPWYDPLLGKIIVHGSTREAARLMLVDALDDTAILGLVTNVGFVRTLANSDAFHSLTIDTSSLDGDAALFAAPDPDDARRVAAFCLATPHNHETKEMGPFHIADGWRFGTRPAAIPISFMESNERRTLYVDLWSKCIIEDDVHFAFLLTEDSVESNGIRNLELIMNGTLQRFLIDFDNFRVRVVHRGQTYTFDRAGEISGSVVGSNLDGEVLSPMPGVVTGIYVQVGQSVNSGQVLGTLEAMKMEHNLTAPFVGVIDHVGSATGSQVQLGHLMFRVSSRDENEQSDVH